MPFNGAGSYSPPAANFPAVPNTLILSNDYNTVVNDIATALTNCVTRDGQSNPSANLPMAGFKHTGVTATSGTASRSEYVAGGTLQDGAPLLIGGLGGTANAITGSLTPAITAYASGQRFVLIPSADNTGATTLALNGLAAKNIFARGGACAGGELAASVPVLLTYDGTQFNLASIASVRVDVFTATGTWTKRASAKFVEFICIGSGGGGGSGRRGASLTARGGGGGAGGGGFSYIPLSASFLGATEAVTVGTGGAGGAGILVNATNGNAGTAGAASSVGNLVAAGGGAAGGGGGNASGGSGGAGGAAIETGGAGSAGSNGSGAAATVVGQTSRGPGGGGGGAGVTGGNVALAASAGASVTGSRAVTLAGGAAGSIAGAGGAGGVGDSATEPRGGAGGGGGGVNSSGSGVGFAGGNGGSYGAGGGGAGATTDGNNGGAGGNGADGIVVAITHF